MTPKPCSRPVASDTIGRLWHFPLGARSVLVKIGREAGLHYATVSRIIKAMEEMS